VPDRIGYQVCDHYLGEDPVHANNKVVGVFFLHDDTFMIGHPPEMFERFVDQVFKPDRFRLGELIIFNFRNKQKPLVLQGSALNEQVKRNSKRFPEDFMFKLTAREKQEVIAFCDNLSRLRFSPHLPYAFTEHGAVMLASVLNGDRAIYVNLQIIRVYTRMRTLLQSDLEILKKLDELQKK